jgi:hypothetical protein
MVLQAKQDYTLDRCFTWAKTLELKEKLKVERKEVAIH